MSSLKNLKNCGLQCVPKLVHFPQRERNARAIPKPTGEKP